MSEYLFPKGLRVLAVDDDRVFLLILEKMLQTCDYEVTKCERGEEALALLREDKSRFDLILCDLHMPEIDGLKLLEVITSETDIPVVIMSGDDRVEAVMKGVIHGACDFLVKPVCMEQIGVIWQHVLRRKQNLLVNQSNFADNMSRISGPSNENLKKRRCDEEQKQEDEEEEEEEEDGEANHEHGTKAKKPRIIWTPELHHKFVQAVQQLGVEKAVPKKILECMQQMGVSDLSRENVASHLQKFRLYIRRKNVELQEQSENSSPLLCRKESSSFEQSCHSSAVCDLQAAQPPYNNIAMAIQGQRTFLDPTITQSRQVNVHTQFGYESKQLLPFLQQPVPMPPQGMHFQNLGQTYNASNIFGHELPRKMFLEGQVMTTQDQLSWRHVGAPHGYGGSVYDQNRELGNIVSHEQYNNFSVDDVTMNGNLYAPFLKEGRVGGVSQQDSDSEGYLCVYNVDNGFLRET